MKSTAKLIAMLLIGLVALSGCSAVRSMLSGSAPASSSGAEVAPHPAAPRFKFYESWASW